MSGNLTGTISDHLPQFARILRQFKSKIYERNWLKFDCENFILEYFSFEWEDFLKIDELNADNVTQMYLNKINMLLDTYAALRRINKHMLKSKPNPWITLGLKKSISVSNKLLILKEEFQTNYKKYRNFLSTLMKKSKQTYHNKCFEKKWNNIKKIWKGIKSLII